MRLSSGADNSGCSQALEQLADAYDALTHTA
jgi:hypothetical protein